MVSVGVAALVMGLLVDRRDLWMLCFAIAAVAFVYAASLAIVDVIQGDDVERSQTAQVALSAFWGGVGLVAIVVGLVRDIRELRFGGLALLGLGVAKVFAYDLAELDQLYRVLSFIAVGIVLLDGRVRVPACARRGAAHVKVARDVAAAAVAIAVGAADVDETQFRYTRTLSAPAGAPVQLRARRRDVRPCADRLPGSAGPRRRRNAGSLARGAEAGGRADRGRSRSSPAVVATGSSPWSSTAGPSAQ